MNCKYCGGSGHVQYGFEEGDVGRCEFCGGSGLHVPENYTCHECRDKDTCKYAFDLYNTNGDCLMEK